jgi:ribosomal protein S18 acetylase RimI-like enzyme
MFVSFLLFMTKDGRKILIEEKIHLLHSDKTVQIGKYILAGKDHNRLSVAISVAVNLEYRKHGIYKMMITQLMETVKGKIIFHTSTESVYQVHEKTGFKRIYEIPGCYPNLNKKTVFIMYGERSMLKL